MHWDEIAGHAGPVKILRNMLAEDKVPHALLFTGRDGLGKMLVARQLAAGLLCFSDRPEKPCGECLSCRKIKQGGNPDFVVLENDGGSLKIDQIRALQNEASLAPYHGGKRVFIIEQAERMTAQAANSLLKILEEPPGSTVFVLTAQTPHMLLPTILSRCWLLQFQPLSHDELAAYLCESGADTEKAAVAARLSAGRIGPALTFLADGGLDIRDKAFGIVASLPAFAAADIEKLAAELDKLEEAELKALLGNISYVLRDILVFIAGQDSLLFNIDMAGKIAELAQFWKVGQLQRALGEIAQSARALNTNASTKLVCEALLIKLSGLLKEGK